MNEIVTKYRFNYDIYFYFRKVSEKILFFLGRYNHE